MCTRILNDIQAFLEVMMNEHMSSVRSVSASESEEEIVQHLDDANFITTKSFEEDINSCSIEVWSKGECNKYLTL